MTDPLWTPQYIQLFLGSVAHPFSEGEKRDCAGSKCRRRINFMGFDVGQGILSKGVLNL
jgi:hypothetical protein